MAWLIGGMGKKEAEELKRRGWILEDPNSIGSFPNGHVAVFVDNDLFKIMSGPDWEGGSTDKIKKMNEAGLTVSFERQNFVTATVKHTAIWWWADTLDKVYEDAKKLGYIKE